MWFHSFGKVVPHICVCEKGGLGHSELLGTLAFLFPRSSLLGFASGPFAIEERVVLLGEDFGGIKFTCRLVASSGSELWPHGCTLEPTGKF